jgi:hypothetical protein
LEQDSFPSQNAVLSARNNWLNEDFLQEYGLFEKYLLLSWMEREFKRNAEVDKFDSYSTIDTISIKEILQKF